eukprot:TRINITY_DN4248_c0_g1_i1.p1 TRINITY_DN4248_c0_g1~~TRINITY_DN4248_c0_g1_i1.p1  ORF type:complete len:273 (+),score=72.50 TRINITY_DN4248_c0_g1_i1:116-934(+)
MQSSQELFFEEFAVRFQIFFKEMASFCDEFLQQQHSSTYKGLSQKRSSFASQLSKANSGTQQGHPRRRKEPVDPDAPKKPPSSFILYFQEKKSEFQSKNPTLSITEITKLIGKAWNNLSAEKQEQFKNKALNLKTNYQHDFEIYAKKKGITIPVKRKPPVPKPKAKQEVQIEEDDEVEIQEIEDDDDDEVVQEEEVEEEEEEEVEEEEEEEEEEVEEVVKAPVQLKNSLKSQQQNKKNAINQQTATNIKEKKIKLIGQASDEEQKVKKKVKK